MSERSFQEPGPPYASNPTFNHNEYPFLEGLNGAQLESVLCILNGRDTLKADTVDKTIKLLLEDDKRYSAYLTWKKAVAVAHDRFLHKFTDRSLRTQISKLLTAQQYDSIHLILSQPKHCGLLPEFQSLCTSLTECYESDISGKFSGMELSPKEYPGRREESDDGCLVCLRNSSRNVAIPITSDTPAVYQSKKHRQTREEFSRDLESREEELASTPHPDEDLTAWISVSTHSPKREHQESSSTHAERDSLYPSLSEMKSPWNPIHSTAQSSALAIVEPPINQAPPPDYKSVSLKGYESTGDRKDSEYRTRSNKLTYVQPTGSSTQPFYSKSLNAVENTALNRRTPEKIRFLSDDEESETESIVNYSIANIESSPRSRRPTFKTIVNNSLTASDSKKVKCFNILILGETGVGKSTFVNSFANYCKYSTLRDVQFDRIQTLIRTSFELTDKWDRKYVILCEPTIRSEQWQDDDNEITKTGQSATQKPRSYVFQTESGEMIRLIDTPGIGDIRGTAKDRENFDSILSYISNFEELHVICILLKSNESRLTPSFRFCLDELLVNLHRSAAANIVFGFTHARTTMYNPGDTLGPLREYLANLQAKQGIAVRCDKQTRFMFESETYRFLCASLVHYPFTPEEIDACSLSWDKSVEEVRRLIKHVQGVVAHNTYDTLNLNNIRNLIASLTRPLADIIKVQVDNANMLVKKMEEVKLGLQQKRVLASQLNVETSVLRCVPCKHPKTVCTSDRCVEYKPIENSSGTQIIYKTVCHEKCYVPGVQTYVRPNPVLKNCQSLTSGICTVCHCPWHFHMHIRYNLEKVSKKIIDKNVESSMRRNEANVAETREFLETIGKQIKQIKNEWTEILRACAIFTVFMKKNSLRVDTDPFAKYLLFLIEIETSKINLGGDHHLARRLQRVLHSYIEITRQVELEVTKYPLTTEKIDSVIEKILNLPICGPQVKDAVEVDLQAMRTEMLREVEVLSQSMPNSSGTPILGTFCVTMRPTFVLSLIFCFALAIILMNISDA